ncbi:MAG: ferrous iron transport protein A [Firmicutes bacterium]|nr:ferrous iron transport protein A [Bacillota bacterium]
MQRTLKDLKPGETGRVAKIDGKGPVKRRLMDMGVTRGTEILIRKVAPLGDPIEVNVRGYELSFRKAEAESIILE